MVHLITCAIFYIFLFNCRADNKDERASRDRTIGNLHTAAWQFSSDAGLLHITGTSQNNLTHDLTLRASAPEFTANISNLTETEQTFSVTIQNIHPQTTIYEDDNVILVDESESINLQKTWEITIPPGSETEITTPESANEPFQFLALGDIQNGIEGFQKVIDVINSQTEIDFILFLGDITMSSGRGEFQKVADAFKKIRFPIFATPGNHDTGNGTLYQDYFGRATYSWIYKGVRFTSVDSASWTLSKFTWEMYKDWLDLAANQPHIVFSHIAPTEPFGLRGGHWKSRREANAFIAHSSRGGVDAMFYGHLHTLDIYNLAGIPVYISGGAGAFQEHFDGIERHVLKVRVTPATSEIQVNVVRVD